MQQTVRKQGKQVWRPQRIMSGGQTGVDRAALDVAIELGIQHGGWCPKGRLAEDGRIPKRYDLQEMPSENYADRTKQNVLDSDGTLILYCNAMSGGTALTRKYAIEAGKPHLSVRLDSPIDFSDVVSWLKNESIQVLNVAGPRASTTPRIYTKAKRFLQSLFES